MVRRRRRRARRRRHHDGAGRSTARPSCAVVREEPPNAFAYRWDANVAGIGDTLVEFTLATEGDRHARDASSRAASPRCTATDEAQSELREGNVGGWKHELGDLERYAQTVAV